MADDVLKNMQEHITADTIRRLYRSELPPEMLPAISEHLTGCRKCREIAQQALRPEITEALDDIRSEELHPRRNYYLLAAALAVVIVGAAAIYVLMKPPATRAPMAAPQVRVQQPPATATAQKTSAPQYADAGWTSLVDTAVAQQRLPYPEDLDTLARPAGVLRGEDETETTALTPAGIVVDTDRPQFTWPRIDSAKYSVSIFDGDDEAARSASLTAPQWTPPRALRRGRTYAWQVEVSRAGATEILPRPPQPPALFRITTAADHDAIRRARELHPDDALLHAVLYARAGLVRDAERTLARAKAAGDARAKTLESRY